MTSYYGYARNSGVPYIKNYAQALERWELTKPIRGREDTNTRPLGHRNRSFNIRKDEQTEAMVLCIWNDNEIVRFEKNGDIIIRAGNYISTSTTNFIADVFPMRLLSAYVFDHSVVLSLNGEEAECRLNTYETIALRIGEDGNYHYKDGNRTFHRTINRTKSIALRKSVEPFIKYARGLCKLNNGEFIKSSEEEYQALPDLAMERWGSMKATFAEGVKQIVQWMQDTNEETKFESWNKALAILVKSYGYSWWNEPNVRYVETRVAKDVTNLMFGAHRAEVFNIEPVTGAVKRDKYKKYFTYSGWRTFHGEKVE